MNFALGICAGLLATVMPLGGITKLFVPKERPAAALAAFVAWGRFGPESFTG